MRLWFFYLVSFGTRKTAPIFLHHLHSQTYLLATHQRFSCFSIGYSLFFHYLILLLFCDFNSSGFSFSPAILSSLLLYTEHSDYYLTFFLFLFVGIFHYAVYIGFIWISLWNDCSWIEILIIYHNLLLFFFGLFGNMNWVLYQSECWFSIFVSMLV